MRCAVVGAGAWGTALAMRLAWNGHTVTMWAREPDVAESISATHTNRFLAGVSLHEAITASTRIEEVVRGAELVVLAPPSHAMRTVVDSLRGALDPRSRVVTASKGLEPESLARMTEVVTAATGVVAPVALSGPTFAAEVARALPTAVVAASIDPEGAALVQRIFHAPEFRVYTQRDVTGVEIAGALKNVVAVATGIADGLRLGYNARAALITRGLAEMMRLGVALGADPGTFAGLAGLGDLVLTCTGELSRNRSLGLEIGGGRTLDEALAGRETVAEGVSTARAARELAARHSVRMPIVESACSVLFGGAAARDAMVALLGREPRPERDG